MDRLLCLIELSSKHFHTHIYLLAVWQVIVATRLILLVDFLNIETEIKIV